MRGRLAFWRSVSDTRRGGYGGGVEAAGNPSKLFFQQKRALQHSAEQTEHSKKIRKNKKGCALNERGWMVLTKCGSFVSILVEGEKRGGREAAKDGV